VRTYQEIILQGDLADLLVQRGDIDGRLRGPAAGREDFNGAGEQLLAPLRDLMGVHFELAHGGLAFQRRERDLCLEDGGVIPTGTAGYEGLRGGERKIAQGARLSTELVLQ